MKCAKGIWLRCGLLPYCLRGQQLALARLAKRGILSVSDGVYRCASPKLDAAPYTENQLLDLVGMTQSTVNGTAFYTAAPPASVSSRGPSGS